MAENEKLYILSLCKELPKMLDSLFKAENCHLSFVDSWEPSESLNIVIAKDNEELNSFLSTHDIDKRSIEFFLLENPANMKAFFKNGGRFVTNRSSFSKNIEKLALRSKFEKNMSIHLQDYIDSEVQKFNIVNHLMIGTSIDELSVYGINHGFDLVSLRSFMDQLTYYLIYLKQLGIAGVPIGVQYTSHEDEFIIRLSTLVSDFGIENILSSFEPNNYNGQASYLLSAASHSCQFFDISILSNPKKVVLTGFFEKDSSSKNFGVNINNVTYSKKLSSKEKAQDYKDSALRESELESAQSIFDSMKLSGGFDEFEHPLESDSILKTNNELKNELIEFMKDHFEEKYPHEDLSDFGQEYFDEFKKSFKNPKAINSLTQSDQDFIIEQVQKYQLAKAYEVARNKLKEDDEIMSELDHTFKDELVNKLAEETDDDLINDILAMDDPLKQDEKNDGEQKTIFGVFKPSINEKEKMQGAFGDVGEGFSTPSLSLDGALDGMDEIESDEGFNIEDSFAPEDSFESSDEDLDEFMSSTLPDFVNDESDEPLNIKNNGLDDSFLQNVADALEDEDLLETFIQGLDESLEDENVVVGGSSQNEDHTQRVGGDFDENDDELTRVSGGKGKSEKDEIIRIGGSFDKEDDWKFVVGQTMDDSKKLSKLNPSVKSYIEDNLPSMALEAAKKYANEQGKDVSELSKDEVRTFSRENIPKMMKGLLGDKSRLNDFKEKQQKKLEDFTDTKLAGAELSEFQKKFKQRLEKNLKGEVELVEINGVYQVPKDKVDSKKKQAVLASTMREVFDEELALSDPSPEAIESKEDYLVNELSVTLNMPHQRVREIVKGAISKTKEAEFDKLSSVFESENKPAIDTQKFDELENENRELKTQVSALQLQLATADKKEDYDDDDADKVVVTDAEANEELGQEIMHLDRSLEKESKLKDELKRTMTDLKKAELENHKKIVVYKKEIKKLKDEVYAKERIVENAKESLKTLMKRKDDEIRELKAQATHKGEEKPGVVKKADPEISLQKEIENLEQKVASEEKSHNETKEKLQQALSEKSEAVATSKTLEKKIDGLDKQIRLLEDQKSNLLNASDAQVRIKSDKLTKENEHLKSQMNILQEKIEKLQAAKNDKSSAAELDRAMKQNAQLSATLKGLNKKLQKYESNSSGGGGTAKEKHLEKNIQKRTEELSKARAEVAEKKKEALKYKGELTGLKNKVNSMQKEIDRLRKHSAKKSGMKKAS